MENNVNTILAGLDPAQKSAVTKTDGPVLIVAGAGSGKTRVLTSRIAYILQKGCEPDNIMALTFTKKAAQEMKERIAAMTGERKARKLVMGTFHSVFIRFLREFADTLGYPSTFTIYDTSDSISAIKACIKEMKLDDAVYKPKDVLSRISMAKNSLVTVAAYKANTTAIVNDTHAKKPEICNIYARYQEKMKQAGVMDFDDILLNMNLLLKNDPQACASIAGRFRYILVDEYQDTNHAQYLILKKLCQAHSNICVVGDDSQSIYAFRGAKIENILNFRKDFPNCSVFRLEQNYRSTRVIVEAANSLIAKNSSRIPKECYSEGPQGDKIHIIKSYSEQEEALLVVSSIMSRLQTDHARYSDFAILYRTNSQSRAIEEALRKRNLPYMIYSGNSFFDRAEVKDMLAYLKLVVNPNDDESFKRIYNRPARGIGETSFSALASVAAAAHCSLFAAIYLPELTTSGLKKPAVDKFLQFGNMIKKYHDLVPAQSAELVVKGIGNECGLYESYKKSNTIEDQSRAANIEELFNSVTLFVEDRRNDMKEELAVDGEYTDVSEIPDSVLPVVTLNDYLENIALLSAVDVDDDDSNNKVALMTVHSAKGLEFPYVYITGLEENLFPSGSMLSSESEIEEERRLFYVALTRAKAALELTYCTSRMRNGKREENSPSRFLKEIDKQYIDNPVPEEDFSSGWSRSSFGGFGSSFGDRENRYGNRGGNRYSSNAYSSSGNNSSGGNSLYGTSRYGMNEAPKVSSPLPNSRFKPVPKNIPAPPKPAASKPSTPDSAFSTVSVLDLKPGQKIEHNRFGYGTIVSMSGDAAGRKATIRFDNFGEKILLLAYAKLRIVD